MAFLKILFYTWHTQVYNIISRMWSVSFDRSQSRCTKTLDAAIFLITSTVLLSCKSCLLSPCFCNSAGISPQVWLPNQTSAQRVRAASGTWEVSLTVCACPALAVHLLSSAAASTSVLCVFCVRPIPSNKLLSLWWAWIKEGTIWFLCCTTCCWPWTH